MLKSMTGYGRGESAGAGRAFTVEVQSVNHRYLEARARLPRRLVGARLSGPARVPCDLMREARSVGRLTSAAFSPRLGWIGLAVVKAEALGEVVTADGGSLQLEGLPFPQEEPAGRQV